MTKITETTSPKNAEYRTFVPGEIKREEISGTVEKVTIKVSGLEIRPDQKGGHAFFLDGQEIHRISKLKLEWDLESLFTVQFTRLLLP